MRYADDFLLFAESEEEIMRAGELAKKVIEELGLEVAMNKTKIVNFDDDDFSFVGFDFKHWKNRKKDGKRYFMVTPSEKSLKDFKKKIKEATQRKLTLPKEEWINKVNAIVRGKVNYYKNIQKAIELNQIAGQESHCFVKECISDLHRLDAYTRQRLRMCMIHKHPSVRKAFSMTHRMNVEFFCKIGLIPSAWYYLKDMYPSYTIEYYVSKQTEKNRLKKEKDIQRMTEKGMEYYTEYRIKKIANAKMALAI